MTDIFKSPEVEPIPRTALSIAETALSLSLSDRTVHKMVRDRVLPVVDVGTRRLVPVEGLKKWLAEQSAAKTNR